jgi:hypothetical protein
VQAGLHYLGVITTDDDWIVGMDLLFSLGSSSYDSDISGSMTGNQVWYVDSKPILGKSYLIKNIQTTLLTGAGYRFLNHDGRGKTSAGGVGYQRASSYFYLPLIIKLFYDFGSSFSIEISGELDILLIGKQFSGLAIFGGDYQNITNTQRGGLGGRFESLFSYKGFLAGPYIVYWNIHESEVTPAPGFRDEDGRIITYAPGTGTWWTTSYVEPENSTIEVGLKLGYRF